LSRDARPVLRVARIFVLSGALSAAPYAEWCAVLFAETSVWLS